jgi:hypothetical protein
MLNLSGCIQINTLNLWFIFDGMHSIKDLYLRGCRSLEALPDNIVNNSSLRRLDIDECRKIKSLPKLPASLQQLTAVNCTYLDANTIQQSMLENMLDRLCSNYGRRSNNISDYSFLSGSKVPRDFGFQTTEASIVIPPIPKSGLCCLMFCIILSEGVNVDCDHVHCTIYERNKEVVECDVFCGRGKLISDHVLLSCWYSNDKLMEVRNENEGDDYKFSFEFKHYVPEEKPWSTKGIKGCGVIPVYGLEHNLELDGRSHSRVELVELQSTESSAQISKNGNEDDQQQLVILREENEEDLNDKSSCECSIGMKLPLHTF